MQTPELGEARRKSLHPDSLAAGVLSEPTYGQEPMVA